MKLHQAINTGQKTFTSLGEGYIVVNGERFNQTIVVTPKQVLTDWSATDFAALTQEHFDYFLALAPEVVIFGTGSRQHFPLPQLFRRMIDAHIAIEFMDTSAACRTYNILAAEDRKVVAAILL